MSLAGRWRLGFGSLALGVGWGGVGLLFTPFDALVFPWNLFS
ncbi:hypothetical protein AWB68_07849 [Caballeronia choica]|uniref:Uncharacterized protein n=1 Tax=Caballeronia choica TaxID=326476 RepID=A0A158KZX0_9BURK|nr:hypothetical protein AWB68_07849 [Caballeronia choica]